MSVSNFTKQIRRCDSTDAYSQGKIKGNYGVLADVESRQFVKLSSTALDYTCSKPIKSLSKLDLLPLPELSYTIVQ